MIFQRKVICAFLVIFLNICSAYAQDVYPSRPITLVVPNPPGGSSDANARVLSDALTKVLKQPVIVNFKPGVAGQVGNSYVAKAKPDGYTLLMGLSSLMVSPESERIQGKASLYEVSQLEPVAMISNDPMILLVKTESPWKTLGDLVKTAKEKPNMIQSKLQTKKQQLDSTATSKLSSAEKGDFANHSIYVNSQDTKLKSQV